MASAPRLDDPWAPLAVEALPATVGAGGARWWLSGGAALDRWLGVPVRVRENLDVSTTARDAPALVAALPDGFSAWLPQGDLEGEGRGELIAWDDRDPETDPQPILVHDDEAQAWVLRINVEDGTDRAWVYKRDPRLQLPWDVAVLEVDGIPTGAPEVQLIWKALRPRPEDDLDKDAVLPLLSDEARERWERAILRIHPHSSWSIHVRSPMFPAKASWNRPRG